MQHVNWELVQTGWLDVLSVAGLSLMLNVVYNKDEIKIFLSYFELKELVLQANYDSIIVNKLTILIFVVAQLMSLE